MTVTVIHSVRLLTGHEDIADAWVLLADGQIAARGSGSGWRTAANPGPRIDAVAGMDAPEAGSLHPDGVVVIDGAGHTLAPGFIDMHCHGADGAAFDSTDDEAVARALQLHRRHGTTRAVLSLVTAPLSMLEAQVSRIRELTGGSLGVLGSHLEGPFLADEFRGAHDPELLRTADPASIERLIEVAEGTLVQVTLAPERAGSMAAIKQLVASGVKVAVGHTAADYSQTRAAFDAGASILTHAFNGMRGIHHRAPGPVVAAMADARVTLELINDGVHVHPDVVRLAFAGAPGRISLITDAMAATGCADGPYRLGSLEVEVLGGVARLAGGGSIAGSTLTLDAALRQAVHECGVPVQQAIGALTAVPARALGISGHLGDLAVGYAADAVLLNAALEVVSVWAAGERVPA